MPIESYGEWRDRMGLPSMRINVGPIEELEDRVIEGYTREIEHHMDVVYELQGAIKRIHEGREHGKDAS